MIVEAGQSIGSVVLRHKIAEGGMGSVWAAEHVTLHREVAVKFLAADRLGDPEAVQRFAMEGRTMARIQSPNVAQVFDQGQCVDGTPYIVMERLEGVHLGEWVTTQKWPLDVVQVARLLDQVGLALTATHELGIVHRDVKPENIIVSGGSHSFKATLIDFGIAKSIGILLHAPAVTLTGTNIGTASYMSPEQVEGSPDVDERSDVWSLAVVAYWCLTGALPFDGETFAGVCLAIQRGHFRPPHEVRPELPLNLDGWFDKALSLDVDQRFASTALMGRVFKVAAASAAGWAGSVTPSLLPGALEAMDAAFVGVTQTTPESAPPPPMTRVRSNRTTAFALAGAAFGLLAAMAIVLAPTHDATARSGASDARVPVVVLEPAKLEPPPHAVEPVDPAWGAVPLPVEPTPEHLATTTPHPWTTVPTESLIGGRSSKVPPAPSPRGTVVMPPTTTPRPVAPLTTVALTTLAAPATPAAPAARATDASTTVHDPATWRPKDDLGEP